MKGKNKSGKDQIQQAIERPKVVLCTRDLIKFYRKFDSVLLNSTVMNKPDLLGNLHRLTMNVKHEIFNKDLVISVIEIFLSNCQRRRDLAM